MIIRRRLAILLAAIGTVAITSARGANLLNGRQLRKLHRKELSTTIGPVSLIQEDIFTAYSKEEIF
ncbi:MAG: hypothetical protein COW32_05945 [Candidatus Aquicultor secundus]|uniref:Uncharacterized protein n=2 Tax=Candidatus Aquicultor secundus TaxID=1973895 RepID=A0A2M7T836_9ACTN|nr:hypothetical protein [Candidatus Aquicultor secundus]NCO65672.1 hypothetical protein [Solirubrobacter sp.]OIO85964.1 MAG: hypothetical protein AUK32_06350 [Candidatus Aquicultor secundus]PIU27486.1 MAG: hypothetical protein COT10_03180 [Candidatus Aquicultor secundus]PIW22193.1 MAG: hypothetical protein COW32_05945 [Candidatus Aquicultor secundus]PIX52329.1 MAG: hypothetical protein COZ51_04680 [Candidatus Aquicultor secundus]